MKLTAAQLQAANPKASIWCTASAGSGKTKVLTDRLLALMCQGAEPENVRCVTFTRAAAAEMANRAQERLKAWSVMASADVQTALRALGLQGDAQQVARARGLFFQVLRLPGGLRIQTLHSFAEALLRRFSIEAGLTAGFRVMDEAETRHLFRQAFDEVLDRAMEHTDEPLEKAVRLLARTFSEKALFEALVEVVTYRVRLAAKGDSNAALWEQWEVQRSALFGTVTTPSLDTFLAARPWDIYAKVAHVAEEGSAAVSLHALKNAGHSKPEALLQQLQALWMTTTCAPRQRPLKAAWIKEAFSHKEDADAFIKDEQRAVDAFVTQRGTSQAQKLLQAFYRVLADVLKTYDVYKNQQGLQDYDDLIVKATHLLGQDDGWVRYKLDGGIDHLLVDEAQDTSAAAWQLLASMMRAFFESDKGHKTLFVVGDPKQSIYSFQGADPLLFQATQDLFEQRLRALRRPMQHVHLATSFRSSPVVLKVVDQVFARALAAKGVTADIQKAPVKHQAFEPHTAWGGSVTVWPVFQDIQEEAQDTEASAFSPSAEAQLALNVALQIKAWTAPASEARLWLDSKDRYMRPSDVMILVRKRGPLTGLVARFLKEGSVPAAGQDRLLLFEALAVQDVVALARFCVTPFDDLTLAAVLKGPFVNLGEEQLLQLAHGRAGTLWQAVQASSAAEAKRATLFLNEARQRALTHTPLSFFQWLLWLRQGVAACLASLGEAAVEPLEAFLDYVARAPDDVKGSLQRLLAFFEEREPFIKRDVHGEGGVRVLTVHGAKGLEAPCVILADAASVGKPRPTILWSHEGLPLPLSAFSSAGATSPVVTRLKQQRQTAEEEEYNRLLYVALTRSTEHLLVAGVSSKEEAPANSWHTLVGETLTTLGAEPCKLPVAKDELAGLTWGKVGAHKRSDSDGVQDMQATQEGSEPLPAWVFKEAALPHVPRMVSPTGLAAAILPVESAQKDVKEPTAMSSSAATYGEAVHLLLQHLPNVSRHTWFTVAETLLVKATHVSLEEKDRRRACGEALALLQDPAFSFLLAPDVLREAAFLGVPPDAVVQPDEVAYVRGRIDLVCPRADGTYWILDYKTGRPQNPLSPTYETQLSIYQRAVSQSFEGAAVRAGVIWTATRHLTWLENAEKELRRACDKRKRLPLL